ncbi:MAG: c-type cytochrome [Methylococcales bacterium]
MNKHSSQTIAGLSFTAVLSITNVFANEVLFQKYCSACHSNGGNIMDPEKTLSQEHLTKNGIDNIGSISALVSTGKTPMPAFGKHLSDEEIAEVAKYVLNQACANWSASELEPIEPILEQCGTAGNFDIDGNGEVDALTDGLLMMRYLFGIRGNALIENAVANNCNRCTVLEIEGFIQLESSPTGNFDIDGNGEIDALTDGLSMMRYLFGIRGNALIEDAVANNCNRCTVLEIETYLQGYIQ